jgi:hypothetical protein
MGAMVSNSPGGCEKATRLLTFRSTSPARRACVMAQILDGRG